MLSAQNTTSGSLGLYLGGVGRDITTSAAIAVTRCAMSGMASVATVGQVAGNAQQAASPWAMSYDRKASVPDFPVCLTQS